MSLMVCQAWGCALWRWLRAHWYGGALKMSCTIYSAFAASTHHSWWASESGRSNSRPQCKDIIFSHRTLLQVGVCLHMETQEMCMLNRDHVSLNRWDLMLTTRSLSRSWLYNVFSVEGSVRFEMAPFLWDIRLFSWWQLFKHVTT